MMKYTMNDWDFRDMMNTEGSDYANQFSYEGLGLLFEHLSELEGDYEFEKIGICNSFNPSFVNEVLQVSILRIILLKSQLFILNLIIIYSPVIKAKHNHNQPIHPAHFPLCLRLHIPYIHYYCFKGR
jgi:hypothetical protein